MFNCVPACRSDLYAIDWQRRKSRAACRCLSAMFDGTEPRSTKLVRQTERFSRNSFVASWTRITKSMASAVRPNL